MNADLKRLHVPGGPSREAPEGTVPLWNFAGEAYDCGRAYGEACLARRPGYRRYLDVAWHWREGLPAADRALLEARCPWILDVHRGLADAAGPPVDAAAPAPEAGCTSFALHPSVTLDGRPISGQTKDTPWASALQYIVLSLRLRNAPHLLVLAYPGEVLGYGLWSTGSSIFRNSLHSRAASRRGLVPEAWAFAALAAKDVHEAAELARRHGIRGAGNYLISDARGDSLSFEFNAGGVSMIPPRDGICTHANHPEGAETAPFEHYPVAEERENSRYRMNELARRFDTERGRLSAPRCLQFLADHSRYPLGICRHRIEGQPGCGTTAAVVAEPTAGRLHVVRGHPCCNWPVTHPL